MTTIRAVFAQDLRGHIGLKGGLPWENSEDLKHFKNLTIKSTVIMGYNTFKSLNFKPLPNRTNIIITHKPVLLSDISNAHAKPPILTPNIETAIEKAKEFNQDINIIGGAQIFKETQPYWNEINKTIIQNEYDGDTSINIDLSNWEIVSETHYPETNTSDARVVQILKQRSL